LTQNPHSDKNTNQTPISLLELQRKLSCLYEITQLFSELDNSYETLMKKFLTLIQAAWKFPEQIAIRIEFQNIEITSPNFRETPWKFSIKKEILGHSFSFIAFSLGEKPFSNEDITFLIDVNNRLQNYLYHVQIKDALRKSERRYRRLFEESPIALKEEDLSDVKKYFNLLRSRGISDFSQFFDQNPEEVRKCARLVKIRTINKEYLRLYHASSLTDLQAGLEPIFTKESYSIFKNELIALANGQTFFEAKTTTKTLRGYENQIYFLLNILPGYEDSFARVLVSVIDITERSRYEDLRKKFIYMASHELRTPISIVNQSIKNLLNYKIKITPELRDKLLDTINRNADLLTDLVEDLLTISHYNMGSVTLHLTTYSFLEIILQTLKQLEALIKAKEIQIDHQIDPHIFLLGDASKIKQIFQILLKNIIKSANKQGQISIRTQDHYKGDYNPKNIDGVLISLSNQGQGIPKADIPYLFEYFYRSQNTAPTTGPDLELSIAREIITLHKGEIYVKSDLGKGTTFSIFLPRLIYESI